MSNWEPRFVPQATIQNVHRADVGHKRVCEHADCTVLYNDLPCPLCKALMDFAELSGRRGDAKAAREYLEATT